MPTPRRSRSRRVSSLVPADPAAPATASGPLPAVLPAPVPAEPVRRAEPADPGADPGLIELHCHLGGSVPAPVLWEIAQEEGLNIPHKTFDALQDALTARAETTRDLDDFLGRFFHLTEYIQSSPRAMETSLYQAVAKAYRRSRVRAIEIRFNPLKRCRGGLHSEEAILTAALQGAQRASLHYGVRTGLILSMGRELSLDDNWRIADLACRFARRGALGQCQGVVGLDLAGPESRRNEEDPDFLGEAARIAEAAHRVGLGLTWHVGETPATGRRGLQVACERLGPDRIGHGLALTLETEGGAGSTTSSATPRGRRRGKAGDGLARALAAAGVCFEVCPSVNLATHCAPDVATLRRHLLNLRESGIPWCLCTDNPYLVHTSLEREFALLDPAGDWPWLRGESAAHARAHQF